MPVRSPTPSSFPLLRWNEQSEFGRERIDVLDVDMRKSEMLQLHGRELHDELRLPALVLVTEFLDFAPDERLHLGRMEAETP